MVSDRGQSNYLFFFEMCCLSMVWIYNTQWQCQRPKCVCCLNNLYVPSIYLNKIELEYVHCIKYLGVLLNDESNDEDDLVHHKKYLYAKGNSLIAKFKIVQMRLNKYCLKHFL